MTASAAATLRVERPQRASALAGLFSTQPIPKRVALHKTKRAVCPGAPTCILFFGLIGIVLITSISRSKGAALPRRATNGYGCNIPPLNLCRAVSHPTFHVARSTMTQLSAGQPSAMKAFWTQAPVLFNACMRFLNKGTESP